MKFKDLNKKQIFTWWGHDHLHTGVALGDGRAFCFDTLEDVEIHANKAVKELEKIPETLTLRFGRNGQAYLCDVENAGRVLARRILLIGGEFISKEELRSGTPPKIEGNQQDWSEVYIIMLLLEKKIDDLGNVLKLVKTALSENLSPDLSDNKIMSPSQGKKLGLLTE